MPNNLKNWLKRNLTPVISEMKDYVDDHSGGGGGGSITIGWNSLIISASGWNASDNKYSLEDLYPSDSYDILNVLPTEDATDAQKDAWIAAECAGYYSTNVIRANGKRPTIDIPVVLVTITK